MGIFAAVPDVELAVITGSDDARRLAFRAPDSAEALISGLAVRLVYGAVHSYGPGLTGGIKAVAPDFPDVYEHILHTQAVQIFGDDIAAVPLCDGVVIETGIPHGGRVYITVHHRKLCRKMPHAALGKQPGNFFIRRESTVSEAEAPGIVESRGTKIQGTAGTLPQTVCDTVHIQKHLGGGNLFTRIETGKKGFLVVSGKGGIYLDDEGVNAVPHGFYGTRNTLHIHLHRITVALGVSADLNILTLLFPAGNQHQQQKSRYEQ